MRCLVEDHLWQVVSNPRLAGYRCPVPAVARMLSDGWSRPAPPRRLLGLPTVPTAVGCVLAEQHFCSREERDVQQWLHKQGM